MTWKKRRFASVDGEVEADLVNEQSCLALVPMDDCIIQIVWSIEHQRLIAVVSPEIRRTVVG